MMLTSEEKHMSIYQGMELVDDPRLNVLKRAYIRLWGVPIIGMRVRLRHVLPVIQGPYPKILDLGSGRGIFAFELAKQFPQSQVTGIDLAPQQVEINNAIAAKNNHKNLRFVIGDILAMPYQDEFDLGLSVDNLEHIADDEAALRGIYAVLKPGGHLICHVPSHDRMGFFGGIRTNFDVPGHVRPGYRPSDLKDKLERAGFVVEWMKPTYGYLESLATNISYVITGTAEKNAPIYACVFPFLNFVAWLGRHQDPRDRGAGILVSARKG